MITCLATGTGIAATIMNAGSVSGFEVNDWRTPGTTKTVDIDRLNNVSGAGATLSGYLGPVSFDIVTEPGAAMLAAPEFTLVLRRSRTGWLKSLGGAT